MAAIMSITVAEFRGTFPLGSTMIKVRTSTKVREVKNMLEQARAAPALQQRIYFHERQLQDALSLGYVSESKN